MNGREPPAPAIGRRHESTAAAAGKEPVQPRR